LHGGSWFPQGDFCFPREVFRFRPLAKGGAQAVRQPAEDAVLEAQFAVDMSTDVSKLRY